MRQTLILDSTQISDFLTCQRYWKYSHNEQLTKSNKIFETTAAGTYGHHLLEAYYKGIAIGMKPVEAATTALSFKLDKMHKYVPLVNDVFGYAYECERCHSKFTEEQKAFDQVCEEFPLPTERRKLVRDIFQQYWMCYQGTDFTPLMGNQKHKIKIVDGKPRDVYESEPLVEQGFSYELLNNEDYLFVLEGRVDMIASKEGNICIVDHKFQDRERDLYEKSIQFRNYSMAMDISLLCINYVRLHKKVNDNTLMRKFVWFNKFERDTWKQRLIEIYKQIAAHMLDGKFVKNEAACPGKFGYKCEFTTLCEEHHQPTIDSIKNLYYIKKERWQPW